jgi:superfamily II DNA helicase RecQ
MTAQFHPCIEDVLQHVTRAGRDWTPIAVVTLNPERDFVAKVASHAANKQLLAA